MEVDEEYYKKYIADLEGQIRRYEGYMVRDIIVVMFLAATIMWLALR